MLLVGQNNVGKERRAEKTRRERQRTCRSGVCAAQAARRQLNISENLMDGDLGVKIVEFSNSSG